MPEDDISLTLEQEKCIIKLSDWMIQNKPLRSTLKRACSIFRTIGKTWLRYKNVFVPPYSPLQKLVEHWEFRLLQWNFSL